MILKICIMIAVFTLKNAKETSVMVCQVKLGGFHIKLKYLDESHLCFPCTCLLRNLKKVDKDRVLEFLSPLPPQCRRPSLGSWFLASAWTCPSYYRHLQSEPADGRIILYSPPFLSPFLSYQINTSINM